MGDYLPRYAPGQSLPLSASAAVVGGQVVVVTGDGEVGPAGANATATLGVAGYDAAEGGRLTVYRGGVHKLKAAGAVAAGDRVGTGAAGTVATAATNKIGTVISGAADGALALVALDN